VKIESIDINQLAAVSGGATRAINGGLDDKTEQVLTKLLSDTKDLARDKPNPNQQLTQMAFMAFALRQRG
jgi:hypothetical protein